MDGSYRRQQQAEQLIFYGVLLFFFGLIVGLVLPFLANPRMGLSSHLEGIMNGIFLMVLGLIWNKLVLSPNWLRTTFWLAIYGTFVNWFAMLIAAGFNAGKNLTIAAQGQAGTPVIEGIINFFLLSLSVAMLIICVAVLVGLQKRMQVGISLQRPVD